MSNQPQKNRFDTHVYAVVRVKVSGTNFSDDPAEVADKIADAVSASPEEWLRPVLGHIDLKEQGEFEVEAVEFADEVSAILVDEVAADGTILKEHFFKGDELPEGPNYAPLVSRQKSA